MNCFLIGSFVNGPQVAISFRKSSDSLFYGAFWDMTLLSSFMSSTVAGEKLWPPNPWRSR